MPNLLKHQSLKPKSLQAGSTLAVISPAAPTPRQSEVNTAVNAFKQGIALLQAQGFQVKLMPAAQNQQAYLAGTDAERLADLHAAFADPTIEGIVCARGGYGCMRLLSQLDYSLIAANPKVFIGFSDVSTLHWAFYKHTGLIGFYGPMLTSNLVNDEPFSLQQLLAVTRGQQALNEPVPNLDAYTCFRPGVATGCLQGGNLSLLTAVCGTPYQPNFDGCIVFLEDWREAYYTLDRKFQQLRLSGMLDNIAGLLLCDFSEIEAGYPNPDKALTLTKMLDHLTGWLQQKGIPVGYGFSVGHGEQTGTLPIGVRARFDAEAGTLCLLESPVIC